MKLVIINLEQMTANFNHSGDIFIKLDSYGIKNNYTLYYVHILNYTKSNFTL